MKIINPSDASSFLEKCQNALEEDEVNSNLILGLSNVLAKDMLAYGNIPPFFSIAYDNNETSLIGLMTPPKNLLIYQHKYQDNNTLDEFVNNVYSKNKDIPGITGEKNIAEKFMEKWVKKSNCSYKIAVNMRVFKLTKVLDYNKPDGIFRNAEEMDIDIIIKYISEFNNAINENTSIEHVKEIAEKSIENKEIYIWENKNIVSMARKHRPTKNGMAVSCVYTPMEYRQKGYATAVVAELSKNILASGKAFCTLYTDLSNPTSNSIYQKIGFKPVCDHINYEFEYN